MAEQLDAYNTIVDAYHDESDRGAAVLAAAFLDDLLRQLVRHHLLEDAAVGELFAGIGPLASFSACARLAYGLRLISAELYRDIDIIRRVRNEFAHSHSALTFRDQGIIDRCRELSSAKFLTSATPQATQHQDPRSWYLFAVAQATVEITSAQRGARVAWL